MIVATVGALIPAVLIAAGTKNTSGNWVDHISEQRILRAAGEPYFIFPILAAFIVGLLSRRHSQSTSAGWVWVLPTVILLWNLLTWKNGGLRPYWPDVWDNFFGPNCGSSECLYENLVTTPFYASLAYTFGWMTKHRLKNR